MSNHDMLAEIGLRQHSAPRSDALSLSSVGTDIFSRDMANFSEDGYTTGEIQLDSAGGGNNNDPDFYDAGASGSPDDENNHSDDAGASGSSDDDAGASGSSDDDNNDSDDAHGENRDTDHQHPPRGGKAPRKCIHDMKKPPRNEPIQSDSESSSDDNDTDDDDESHEYEVLRVTEDQVKSLWERNEFRRIMVKNGKRPLVICSCEKRFLHKGKLVEHLQQFPDHHLYNKEMPFIYKLAEQPTATRAEPSRSTTKSKIVQTTTQLQERIQNRKRKNSSAVRIPPVQRSEKTRTQKHKKQRRTSTENEASTSSGAASSGSTSSGSGSTSSGSGSTSSGSTSSGSGSTSSGSASVANQASISESETSFLELGLGLCITNSSLSYLEHLERLPDIDEVYRLISSHCEESTNYYITALKIIELQHDKDKAKKVLKGLEAEESNSLCIKYFNEILISIIDNTDTDSGSLVSRCQEAGNDLKTASEIFKEKINGSHDDIIKNSFTLLSILENYPIPDSRMWQLKIVLNNFGFESLNHLHEMAKNQDQNQRECQKEFYRLFFLIAALFLDKHSLIYLEPVLFHFLHNRSRRNYFDFIIKVKQMMLSKKTNK